MSSNTPIEIVNYYQSLLIYQYLNKPKASGTIGSLASQAIMPQTTVQNIAFSGIPNSGTFVLSYNGVNSAVINWNDSTSTIQSKLQAISGLGSVTVTGSFAIFNLIVTFTGVIPPALSLIVFSNSLTVSSVAVNITITETDEILPLAVQDAFNLIAGTSTAVGAQLDILGKYVGVTRTGNGFNSVITLDDADFLQLIRMAIVKNSSGSSLATIVQFLYDFFPNQVYVVDDKLMHLTFTILVGSRGLIELFITEGILPVPMGVGYTVVWYPTSGFFELRTYTSPIVGGFPLNSYADYQMDWPMLSYADAIIT